MRKLSFIFIFLLISSPIYAQSTASYGINVTSLSTSGAGAVTGTAFGIPTTYAAIITWQVVADGSALSVNLEGSNDNSTYFTIDSQTAATGGIKNFGFTAVKFVRCSQVSRTGGTATTCTFTTNRGFINNSGGVSLTKMLVGDGTVSAPSYSFLSSQTTGLFQRVVGHAVDFAFSGIDKVSVNDNTGISLSSALAINWTATVNGSDAADTTLSRGGSSGKVVIGGGTPFLAIGGTSSSFPGLKQVGASLQARLADDSGNANITAASYFVGGSTGSVIGNASDGVITLTNNAVNGFGRLQFGGTTSSFPALKQSGALIQFRLADDSGFAALTASTVNLSASLAGTSPLIFVANPTISSGFGTSPSVVTPNGTAAFTINIGTGGTATSGVIGLPTATTGWNCYTTDITATAAHAAIETRQTASTTTTATIESQNRSTGAATAWAASSIIRAACFAY